MFEFASNSHEPDRLHNVLQHQPRNQHRLIKRQSSGVSQTTETIVQNHKCIHDHTQSCSSNLILTLCSMEGYCLRLERLKATGLCRGNRHIVCALGYPMCTVLLLLHRFWFPAGTNEFATFCMVNGEELLFTDRALRLREDQNKLNSDQQSDMPSDRIRARARCDCAPQ